MPPCPSKRTSLKRSATRSPSVSCKVDRSPEMEVVSSNHSARFSNYGRNPPRLSPLVGDGTPVCSRVRRALRASGLHRDSRFPLTVGRDAHMVRGTFFVGFALTLIGCASILGNDWEVDNAAN